MLIDLLRSGLRLLPGLLLAAGAAAQTYPVKPVRIVVGFAAGGSGDLIARLVAQKLSESQGQPFIVENRPGASSNIGSAYVAKAAADAYTLLLGSHTMAANVNLFRQLPFDLRRDFVPVVLVDRQPNMLVLHPSVPVRSVQEFIALAKSRPGRLNYATAGPGSGQHMAAAQFIMLTGVDMLHVPYKGGAPAVTDLIGGQVDLMIGNLPETMAFVQSGKLRGLAVTSVRRQAMLPAIPTMRESGLAGYEHVGWHGLFGPTGMPNEIVQRLNAAVNRALAAGDLSRRLEALGLEVAGGSGDDFRAVIENEIEKSARLVKAAGIPLQ
jgi:tripartite-type tricarboxylate transporter receptor subunit TctC